MPDAEAAARRGQQFGRLIREARLNGGLTQDALVAESGVSRSTILRWERGEAERPDPEQVRAVCRVLRIDPVKAAVALGYITAEEAGLAAPEESSRPSNPTFSEVLDILEGGGLTQEEIDHWVGYLRYLRQQARERRKAG